MVDDNLDVAVKVAVCLAIERGTMWLSYTRQNLEGRRDGARGSEVILRIGVVRNGRMAERVEW